MGRRFWHSRNLEADYSDSPDDERKEVSEGEANLVSSLVSGNIGDGKSIHMPAIDIDLPCVLRESETPGHFHLFIEKEMTWDQYRGILDALEVAGVIEQGFRNLSVIRGATFVALRPWKEAARERQDH